MNPSPSRGFQAARSRRAKASPQVRGHPVDPAAENIGRAHDVPGEVCVRGVGIELDLDAVVAQDVIPLVAVDQWYVGITDIAHDERRRLDVLRMSNRRLRPPDLVVAGSPR